jgi:hypothetical protein
MTEEDVKVLESAMWWLEGALQCKTWAWDEDQREAASWSLIEATRILENYKYENVHRYT